MSSCPKVLPGSFFLLTICICALASLSWGQVSHSEQVLVKPPLLQMVDPPAPNATPADLEARADQLRAAKLFLARAEFFAFGAAATLAVLLLAWNGLVAGPAPVLFLRRFLCSHRMPPLFARSE